MGGKLRETTTGATSRLDLVVGISGEKIKELCVEPMVDGIIDLILVVATQEGATKRGDSDLGKMKELSLVNDDIEQGVALATEEVVSVLHHGGDALVMRERVHLGLLGFGCFLGVVELATGLGMGMLGGVELELGLLDRGLGLGGGSLECGGLSNVRVGGGHGGRRSEKGS